MTNENQFLLYALALGAFITFVYDLLRIFRRLCFHGSFLISLEDLCFWMYCSVEVFLLMYHESNGTLRWFAVLGAMAGMFLYKKLFSHLFVTYMVIILQKIIDLISNILKFVFKPLWFALGKAQNIVYKVQKRRKMRQNSPKQLLKKRLTLVWKMLKM